MFESNLLRIFFAVLLAISYEGYCFEYNDLDSPIPLHEPHQRYHIPNRLLEDTNDQTDRSNLPSSFKLNRNHDDDLLRELTGFPEQDKNDVNAESSQKIKRYYLKRRKGPTLSVVNPLEILRQQLMLDLARRRLHANERQIVANAELLESLGKRSDNPSADAHSRDFDSSSSEKSPEEFLR